MRAAVLSSMIVAALGARAAASPDDLVARPIVLERGELEGALTLETDLSSNAVGDRTSLAPDLWYGVTPELTVGVVHSANALSLIDAGDGVCFGGLAHGCEQAYSNLGVDARYALVRGEWSVAARVRLVTRRWTPWLPSVRLGALARWQRGRFAITSDPQLQIGLDNTDRGNRAQLNIPLWLALQPAARWEIYVRTGVSAELAVFGDAWGVPAVAGVRTAITPRVDLAVEGGFARAGGPLNESKLRVAWIAVDVRLGP